MTPVIHPTREQVRQWMQSPARKEGPPPTLEEIRRQLGWHLVPGNGAMPEVKD